MGPEQDARGAGGSAPGAQAAAPGSAKAPVTDRRWGRGPACSPGTPRTAAVLRSARDTWAGRRGLYRVKPLTPPRSERRPSPAALPRAGAGAGALARSHLPVSPAPAQPPPQSPQPAARVSRARPRLVPPREAVPKRPRQNLARLDSPRGFFFFLKGSPLTSYAPRRKCPSGVSASTDPHLRGRKCRLVQESELSLITTGRCNVLALSSSNWFCLTLREAWCDGALLKAMQRWLHRGEITNVAVL